MSTRIQPLTFGFLLAPFLLLAAVTAALADSWLPPQETTYTSSSGAFVFTVMPPSFEERDKYYNERYKDKGNRPSTEELRGRFPCVGRLVNSKNHDETVWERPLLNDIAPVSALVTSNGNYVVTFDEWHSVGYGPNVVVIYGSDGKVIRRLSLADFLSKGHIASLPHSVSSIFWGAGHYIDEAQEKIILRVFESGTMFSEPSPEIREIQIVLATGEIVESAR